MRRILIVTILIVIAGTAVWYFGFRPKTNPDGSATTSGFKSFFPLGGAGGNNNTDGQISDTTPVDTGEPTNPPSSLFKQLSVSPISGYSTFALTKTITIPPATPKEKPTTQTITDYFVRYVARQNGFVYEIKNDESPLQISNTFVPAVYEAYFADNNNTAILRFLRDDARTIGTYTVPIPPENPDGTRTQNSGIFLPDGITSFAVSPDSKEVARLTQEQTLGVITTESTAEKNTKELLRTPLKELLISWPQTSTLFVQTKAAGIVPGFLYKVDRTERRLRRVVGDVAGLTASVSPSGVFVFYSESTKDGFTAKILNTKTGITKNTGLSILPEKCVWLKNEDLVCAGNSAVESGTYPDVWYAGLVSFSDQLFHIYTSVNTFDVINKGDERGFDMVNLQTDEDRNLLFFVDKKTGLLWQFSLL
ncbi:MAG: hypothetical protein AAB681_01165 [Patescibacteria group bacterium]